MSSKFLQFYSHVTLLSLLLAQEMVHLLLETRRTLPWVTKKHLPKLIKLMPIMTSQFKTYNNLQYMDFVERVE